MRQLGTFPFVSAKKGALGRIPSVFSYTLLAGQSVRVPSQRMA
jgi:hypothetical protein